MTTSMYAVVFDQSCFGWSDNRKDNIEHLKKLEKLANDDLNKYGYVYLKSIYAALGKYIMLTMPSYADCCGWLHKSIKGSNGDGYIEFIFDENETGSDVTIDFNVDGVICH